MASITSMAMQKPKERILGDNELIVSKTDVKGVVTYANRAFMNISGYSESEILGKQHNFIRHPEMPRACFELLWDTLKRDEEFFAYVINRCKNGDYYWVLANITPDKSVDGKLIGYYSVRRRAPRNGIQKIQLLYQQMLKIEAQHRKSKQQIQRSTEYLMQQLETVGLSYQDFILTLDS